ncbi:hypothetical protein D3C78_1442380 [compost metagenome]
MGFDPTDLHTLQQVGGLFLQKSPGDLLGPFARWEGLTHQVQRHVGETLEHAGFGHDGAEVLAAQSGIAPIAPDVAGEHGAFAVDRDCATIGLFVAGRNRDGTGGGLGHGRRVLGEIVAGGGIGRHQGGNERDERYAIGLVHG